MHDLISRQAAIDAVVKESEADDAYGYMDAKSIIDLLYDLPSAQPERPPEIQDILNYLNTVLHPIISPEHWDVYSELYDMISNLPSAEPKIIWCRDCKYWKDSDGVYRRGFDAKSKCPLNLKEVYEGTFYCGMAERR